MRVLQALLYAKEPRKQGRHRSARQAGNGWPSIQVSILIRAPIIDQGSRPGVITRLIIFILVLTGAALFFALSKESLGEEFFLGILGILAMVGIGYLFASAIGFIQLAPRSTGDELAKHFVDSMDEGLVVTDTKGRIMYANRAYAELTGATSAADVQTVEALLSDNAEASPTVERLSLALRDGKSADGEFRLSRPIRPGAEPTARWYRAWARVFKVPVIASRSAPGSSWTSPPNAPSRNASSSTCRRLLTISTMLRPVSSPPMRRAGNLYQCNPCRVAGC